MPSPRKLKVVRSKAKKPKFSKKSKASSLISISAMVCENVLIEADGVMSAIRIVDVFLVGKLPDIPVERQAVPMRVLVLCKFKHGDRSEHTIHLQLIRPDGTVAPVGELFKGPVDSARYAEAPGGFNVVAQVGVIPKQMGTHYIAVLIDGQEVARLTVTLLQRKLEVVG